MTRRRLLLLFLPALLLGLLATGFTWLLRSESGAAWVWQRVVVAVPGELRAERLGGSLQSGVRLDGVSYRQEGFALEADRVALRLDFDLLPPSLSVEGLRVGELRMKSETEDDTEDAVDWSWIPGLELPLALRFPDARADRLLWAEGDAPPAVDLRDLSLSLDWHRSLELEQARFSTPGSQWQAAAGFDLQAPHALELTASGNSEFPSLAAQGTRLELRLLGSGSLTSSHWSMTVPERGLSVTADLADLLEEPHWDLQLEAARLEWPPDQAQADWVLEDLFLSSYGRAGDFDVEGAGTVSGEGVPPFTIRLVGEGQDDSIRFELVDAEGESLAARGTGRLAWAPSVAAEAELEVARFDPAGWTDAWAGAPPFSGSLRLGWRDDTLTFSIPAAGAPGTVAEVRGNGTIDTDSGVLLARLTWGDFSWPPGSERPQVLSEAGQLRLGGTVDAWTVEGDLALSAPGFPAGRLQISGGGDRSSLNLDVPDGQVLGGRLGGRFEADWSGAVSWSAEVRLENVSTDAVLPAFPGTVSGAFSVRERAAGETGTDSSLQIDIQSLAGVVRNRSFEANGGLALEAGRLNARGLRLRSGQSVLTADGHTQGAEGLSLALVVHSLGDLLEGAAGRFEGRGTLSLKAGRPRLALEGSGRDLSWDEWSAAELQLQGVAGEGGVLELEARTLQLGDTLLDQLDASLGGATPLEQVWISMRSEQSEARFRLRGGVKDWNAPLAQGWGGQIEDLRLDHSQLGYIALEEPADLRLSATAATLGEACFRGSREGLLCLEGDWQDGGSFRLNANLERVSPNLAMRLLDSELSFSQRLNGDVEWRRSPGQSPVGQVRLEVTPGRISEPGEDDPILTSGPGRLSFSLAGGALHSGILEVPLEGEGRIGAEFRISELAAGANATVEGRLQIDLESIEPLVRLVPGVQGRSGPVAADLRMGGSLADPKMTGHLSLVRGRLSHFASGLVLDDITLAGAVYEYDQTELSGSFRAGEGRGTLRTVLNFDDPLQPEILLQVKGSRLTLVDVPDLRVIADPDLRLIWRQGILNVDGRVEVPSARLSPRYLPTASATESEDVVIVAGSESLAQAEQEPSKDYRIRGRLELVLGQDVQLLLDRATARLTGDAEFRWNGQLVPVADGGFGVSGEIYAYGQLLTVTDGRINFSGRPADNPFLNIRAQREIYGSTQVTEAGVRVTGTLKEPDLEVYTVPMTTRERALTMLVTGNDFSYEQGVGSVEVGMYVAPKLYISYGIGLFDDQNVISARYDLGKGFGVKTTSGQRETGADISYTIER